MLLFFQVAFLRNSLKKISCWLKPVPVKLLLQPLPNQESIFTELELLPANACDSQQKLEELRESLTLCGIDTNAISDVALLEMEATFANMAAWANISNQEAISLREQLRLPDLGSFLKSNLN